ncbi:MAG: outer membrane protein assembly factor BamE [Desulfarculus sp.]|nr:outer membrane protein assembly factor BamE [Desulfarculus sp.]
MSRRLGMLALTFAMIWAAGCAASAKDQMAKLQVGMKQPQVEQILGKPEEVKQVKFKGHDDYYEVWQYAMVPDTPLCPSEAIPRFVTDVATLGLAEIAWTNAQATAHWIYFLDGELVYTSAAFDCLNGEFCQVRRSPARQHSRLMP